jgi:hypothetical protein
MSGFGESPETARAANAGFQRFKPNETLRGEVFEMLAACLPGYAKTFGQLAGSGGARGLQQEEDLIGGVVQGALYLTIKKLSKGWGTPITPVI